MNLQKLEQLLLRATTLDQLNKILTEYLADFGITTFSFTYYAYHPHANSKIKYSYASKNLQKWHKHYLTENYDEVDTVLDREYRGVLPIYWSVAMQIKNAKGRREKQMRLDSIKFGTVQGLSIPVHGPNDDFANLMVSEVKGQKCLERWQEIQYELFTAAYCYYYYLQTCLLKLELPQEKLQLSKREIQVMRLIAQNFTMREIAKILAITERTVNFHIQRVNKRLGTNNKYQSVIILTRHKILTS